MEESHENLYKEINLIITNKQAEKINSHIYNFIKENLDVIKINTSFHEYNHRLSNYFISDRKIYFRSIENKSVYYSHKQFNTWARENSSNIGEMLKNISWEEKSDLKLSNRQKTAVLFISLPLEVSAQIAREFPKERIGEISNDIAKLPELNSNIREKVIREFLQGTSAMASASFSKYGGDYVLSFFPEKRELKLSFPEQRGVNFTSDSNNISLKILSPSGKILNFKNSADKDCFLKITCGIYLVTFIIIKKTVFLIVFNTKNFKLEKDLFLCSSEGMFNLYINRELKEKKDGEEKEKQITGNTSQEHNQQGTEIKKKSDDVDTLLAVDPIALEVGRGLLAIVDPRQGAKLLERVTSIRRHILLEMGLVLPGVRFRDNLQLKPNGYIIKVKNIEVAAGEAITSKFLAIGPENLLKSLKGSRCFDPTYGMPAIWIAPEQKAEAERLGCMIFDSVSVMATQITEVIRTHASELLGRREVTALLERIKKTNPAVVNEVYPDLLGLREMKIILQNLLKEYISIRDMVTILETLADYVHITRDTDMLTEYVRVSLAGTICREYQLPDGSMKVMTINEHLENSLKDSVKRKECDPETRLARKFLSSMGKYITYAMKSGLQPVVLCSPEIRHYLKRLTLRAFPKLAVLSYNEIVPGVNVERFCSIDLHPSLSLTIKRIRNIVKKIITRSVSIVRIFNKKQKKSSNTESSAISNDVNYLCLLLDISREHARELLRLFPDPERALMEVKKNPQILINSAQNSKTYGQYDKKSKLESLLAFIEEMDVWNKINGISAETGATLYEAFVALASKRGDLTAAINQLKGIPSEEKNSEPEEDYWHILFEPRTWEKLEYIIKETSCTIADALKTFIEFNEDELAAIKAIKDRKKF